MRVTRTLLASSAGRLNWLDADARRIMATRGLRTFAQTAVMVVVAIYLDLRGFTLVEVGVFLSLGSAGAAASALVVGLVGDAIGRRRTLVGLALLMTVTGVILATSEHFPVLVAAAFIGSFSALAGSGGGMGSLEQAILPVCVPPERRTDVFAWNSIVGVGAGALGALASGLVPAYERGAGVTGAAAFRVLFVGYAIAGLLLAVIYSRLSARVEIPEAGRRWTNPLTLPSRRRILTLSTLFAVDSFGTGLAVESLASYWFFTRFGLRPEELGLVFFASSVLTAVSLWAATRVAARIGLLNTMVFTHIPASLFLIGMVLVPDAWMAIALWLLRAFFGQMDAPTSQSYTMAVVQPTERTAMASATIVFRSTGVALGPTVAAALWTTAAASVPFICGGLVKITYDLTLWGMFRRLRPPEEEMPLERPARDGAVLVTTTSPQGRRQP
jgi:MFS family permease